MTLATGRDTRATAARTRRAPAHHRVVYPFFTPLGVRCRRLADAAHRRDRRRSTNRGHLHDEYAMARAGRSRCRIPLPPADRGGTVRDGRPAGGRRVEDQRGRVQRRHAAATGRADQHRSRRRLSAAGSSRTTTTPTPSRSRPAPRSRPAATSSLETSTSGLRPGQRRTRPACSCPTAPQSSTPTAGPRTPRPPTAAARRHRRVRRPPRPRPRARRTTAASPHRT